METESRTKSMAVLVLAILGSNWPDSMTEGYEYFSIQFNIRCSSLVTRELLKLLRTDTEGGALRIAAAELLGKGFPIWKQCKAEIHS